jgi:exonuclease SbcC
MLPLKLSIEGLYSYQKKQTIDFAALTEAGLFGIFGAVGSGKSSVLEAIGFVLYGETERLNKTDKRSYNMLNLKSNQASIDFEFLNYENRKFKFVANWNRKKKFDETTPLSRAAYEMIGQVWIPLDSADAAPIIGLSYDNFRRTIIIPQGKFKEFLDLKGKDRSDMMKEIFNLHKYDLSLKVGILQSATKSNLDQLKGQLSGYEKITNETIHLKKEEHQKASEILEANKENLKKADAEFTVLNTLKTNFEELENRKAIFLKFNLRKPEIDALQAEISEYEKVEKVFGANLITLSQSNTALVNAKADYSLTENNFKKIQETIIINEKALLELQPQFDNLETSKNIVLDLESIVKVLKLNTESNSFEDKIKIENDLIVALSSKEQEVKNKLKHFQKEITELKLNKIDTSILLAVGQWFMLNKTYQKSLEDTISNIKSTSDDITSAKESFKAIGLSITSWETDLNDKSRILETTKKQFETSKNKLLVAKELAQFSHNLHDGESCPLCGSLEHPNPMQVVDVTKDIEVIESQILEVEKQEREIRDTFTKAEKIKLSVTNSGEKLLLLQTAKEQIETNLKNHLQSFNWKVFDPLNFAAFEKQQQAQEKLELSIKTVEGNEKTSRELLDKIADELKIHTANQSKINSDWATILGAIDNELSQLKVISFQDYQHKDIASVQFEKITLEAENNRIATEFKSKSDEVDRAKKNAAELKGRLDSLKERVELTKNSLNDIKVVIDGLLIENKFNTIENVQLILDKTFDVDSEKAKISQFVIDLQTAKKLVEESEKLVEGKEFDVLEYENKAMHAKDAKDRVDSQIGIVASLVNELEKMLEEFDKKSDLITQYAAFESRAANLSTLSNMFTGNGFVNYVSSIYLQNLADVANIRFHRMTKNQLSLQINSLNEFEVIDYLNNGAARSVKTLSGGQGFQASLCLALALAESVQSLNKTDKNFFFIDEGFGTQDPESVAVVFETLQSLYKENRVVGIISHVTELQERIPRSINVVKHEDEGSEIYENWK